MELQKSKARGNTDQNLISEIARIESALTIARDDLVRTIVVYLCVVILKFYFQSAGKHRLNGLKDEIKHIDKELKKTSPDLNKVSPNALLT
jgi:structural maintenance of chromosome 1